jgi:hypothetical protein
MVHGNDVGEDGARSEINDRLVVRGDAVEQYVDTLPRHRVTASLTAHH